MKKGSKALLIFGTLIGVAGLSYLGYWLYKRSQTTSGNPDKDNRKILITRNK
jgi:uncharacterized membrane protein YebE (DUF533 family)